MAAVDWAAMDAGLPGMAMMESAGRAVTMAIRERWSTPGRAVVLVGSGNNGGDGLVVARYLAEADWGVELRLFTDPGKLKGDAAAQWSLIEPMGLEIERVVAVEEVAETMASARDATCVVDALLGSGLQGEVREPIRSALLGLERITTPIVAVDIPSGLDGSSGHVLGAAATAALTVTFGFPQPGLFLAEGPERAGRVIVSSLGYPPAALSAAGESPLSWSALSDAMAVLPGRRHDTHKGDAGRLLIVAGSENYRGAAVLAATSALRSGVGLCVVATPEPIADAVLSAIPEAILLPLPVTKAGALSARAAGLVAEAAEEATAIAVGPGLSTGNGVDQVVATVLKTSRPALVDADALNSLAPDPSPVSRSAPTIITPHPGELGRWLDRPAGEVDVDRLASARQAADRWGVHVVLKGSPTVITDPTGAVTLNLTGNPGLAVGGSGDVLTGLLGSLLAQGNDASSASLAAPLIHGLAADWARTDRGERGVIPSDLFGYVPLTIRELSAGRGQALLERLDHSRAQLLAATGGRG